MECSVKTFFLSAQKVNEIKCCSFVNFPAKEKILFSLSLSGVCTLLYLHMKFCWWKKQKKKSLNGLHHVFRLKFTNNKNKKKLSSYSTKVIPKELRQTFFTELMSSCFVPLHLGIQMPTKTRRNAKPHTQGIIFHFIVVINITGLYPSCNRGFW